MRHYEDLTWHAFVPEAVEHFQALGIALVPARSALSQPLQAAGMTLSAASLGLQAGVKSA